MFKYITQPYVEKGAWIVYGTAYYIIGLSVDVPVLLINV